MLIALLCASVQSGSGPVDLPRLLAELTDRTVLARFPEPTYRAFLSSSNDPASLVPGGDPFANADAGHFQPTEREHPGDEHVLLDALGPGTITRIWSANPEGRLRVYVDDTGTRDSAPVLDVDMRAFLTGRGSVSAPLASERARGANLYLPIPFARRVIVTADHPGSLYYHVEWRRYAAATEVTSFASGDLERHAGPIARANAAWTSIEAPRGEDSFTYHLSRQVPEGELLAEGPRAAVGPRAVSELRLRVDAADRARALRTCVLRLVFDGETTVAVPLGAFFGAPEDLRPIRSWFLSVDESGDLVARFVMPYRESFDLRIENAGDPDLHISGVVRTIPWSWDERSLHFHALWRASGPLPTRPMQMVRHARVVGRGVLVGDLLAIANPVPEWWGEGDESITVDGERLPSHWGTGTEDAYGYAWCDPTPFQAPLHGQTRCDGPGNFGRTDVYRFRVLDAVPFERELDYALENWHWADTTIERAACVVYYARPGAKDDAPPVPRDPSTLLPKLPFRRVAGAVEAESARVAATSPGLACERQAYRGTDWSGGLQLWARAQEDGDYLELEIPAEPGRRTITVLATRSYDYGILRFSIDGSAIETRFDARSRAAGVVEGGVQVPLGEHLVGNSFRLRVEVVGTSVEAEGPRRYFGLDAIVVR
ncbi:MAG: DUF2961 domain-containing protein [Planctomycetota bacterium]|nr:DUF2961 domain-containing protein [Planctomycetota bacterium]